jgi:hypothetical protein
MNVSKRENPVWVYLGWFPLDRCYCGDILFGYKLSVRYVSTYSSTFPLDGNNEDFRGVGIPGYAWPPGKLNSIDHVSNFDSTKEAISNLQFFCKNMYS